MSWISTLPEPLRTLISGLVTSNPSSLPILTSLYAYLDDNKRRKIAPAPVEKGLLNTLDTSKPGFTQLQDSLIKEETVIFEINQVSFQSPIRKKMNLTFHLVENKGEPVPILSIINPATKVAELLITELSKAIKLCCLFPIVGNLVTVQKKIVVNLCIWLHDEYLDNDSKDPIVCQLNLDLIKKYLIKTNKLPANIEAQLSVPRDTKDLKLNAVHERIIDYYERQFRLCGIDLLSFLPCGPLNQFSVNTDNAIAISNHSTNVFLMVECHKGAKDGVLIFLNDARRCHVIFGFKKPILIYSIDQVRGCLYSNVTSKTFNLSLVVVNDREEERELEFSIIDHKYFELVDEWLRRNNLTDGSFDEKMKEKQETTGNNTAALVEGGGEDEDSEEDEDYNGGAEGSDVDEEFDSDADSDGQEPTEGEVFSNGQEVEMTTES